jgi:hypothetical protein
MIRSLYGLFWMSASKPLAMFMTSLILESEFAGMTLS